MESQHKAATFSMANMDTTTHSYLHTELERRRASLQAAAAQAFRRIHPHSTSQRGRSSRAAKGRNVRHLRGLPRLDRSRPVALQSLLRFCLDIFPPKSSARWNATSC